MMKKFKRPITFLFNEAKSNLMSFWIVITIINILSFAFTIIVNTMGSSQGVRSSTIYGIHTSLDDNTTLSSIAGANFMVILIFFVILSYLFYYEIMPIAVGFSTTRKGFFVSLIVTNIIIAFITSLIQTIFLKFDYILIKKIGKEPFTDFTVFNSSTDNPIFIFFSIFFISIFVLGLLNLLASANYKFGYIMWIVLAVFVVLILPLFPTGRFEGISKVYEILFSKKFNLLTLLLITATSVFTYGLSSFLIRNVNIKAKLS